MEGKTAKITIAEALELRASLMKLVCLEEAGLIPGQLVSKALEAFTWDIGDFNHPPAEIKVPETAIRWAVFFSYLAVDLPLFVKYMNDGELLPQVFPEAVSRWRKKLSVNVPVLIPESTMMRLYEALEAAVERNAFAEALAALASSEEPAADPLRDQIVWAAARQNMFQRLEAACNVIMLGIGTNAITYPRVVLELVNEVLRDVLGDAEVPQGAIPPADDSGERVLRVIVFSPHRDEADETGTHASAASLGPDDEDDVLAHWPA